jgi:dihydroorotate dehydrogenase
MGAGGLSGAPLADRSLQVLELLASHLKGRLGIVSVGGVETKEDVQRRLQAGATLVQGYTGFIYQGPLWAKRLNS